MILESRDAPDFFADTLETAASNSKQTALWNFVIAWSMVAVAVCLGLAFHPILGKLSLFLLLPIVVLVASRFGGWLPGLLATVLSILGGWFFLTNPPYSFQFADKSEAEGLAVYAISATAISLLGGQVHATLLSKTRSERAARQSESLVRALLDSAAQAILAVNTDGKIVMANEMAETIFGYKREELMHQSLDLLIPEGAGSREHLKGFFANPSKRPAFDAKARHKSGASFPVEIGLSHIQTAAGGTLGIAFVTDITQRKHAEEERQKFVLLAESSPEFIGMCDLDFKPFYINRAGMRLVGLENLDFSVPDAYFPEDQAFIADEFFPRVLRDGRGTVEIRLRHFKTGEPIWMHVNLFTICDASGAAVGYGTVSLDLTERKRAENEIHAALEQVRALQKKLEAENVHLQEEVVSSARLSALGAMAGGIAHEVNNPLGIIQASAENMLRMAESGSVHSPAILENCNRIMGTVDRISRIVRSLRSIAREGSADEFRQTPVRGIVDETLELCSERFRSHNIRLDVPAVDPGAVISCREAQICQVLLNLLQNAFDEVVNREGDRWVKLDVTCRPPWVAISVSDSGQGIALENRSHIMEPFFTTKPVGQGTGLGLSISRSIALEHEGTLVLDQSSPHTRFVMKLPLSGGT